MVLMLVLFNYSMLFAHIRGVQFSNGMTFNEHRHHCKFEKKNQAIGSRMREQKNTATLSLSTSPSLIIWGGALHTTRSAHTTSYLIWMYTWTSYL